MVYFPQLDSGCLPFSPLPLHLFLPSFSMKWEGMGFFQQEQWWLYCQHELPIVAVCQAGPLPSCCHHGAQMWWGKLWWIHCGGNKAWRPTDLTPLSSWYQTCQTQTSQSAGSNKQHITQSVRGTSKIAHQLVHMKLIWHKQLMPETPSALT